MTSKEHDEPYRPAEVGTSTSDAERLYGCSTPLPDNHDAGDWEPYSMRKHPSGTQSAYGVLRNDRTPLNTPYTPAVVKLQLRRQEENESLAEEHSRSRALMSTIAATACHLVQPLRYIQSFMNRALASVLPDFIMRTNTFDKHRHWIAWYLTTMLSIPLALLLSPMVIAFCICTSPIWVVGAFVLFVRAWIPTTKLDQGHHTEEYVHSPHRLNGVRVNGVTSSTNGHHNPSLLHRRGIQGDHE